MSPYRRPGWAQPNGHIVRSNTEAALCDYLTAAMEPHIHASLHFDVPIGLNQYLLYIPSIILTHSKKAGRTILIQPLDSINPGGGARRLQGFRQQHGADYFVIVLARRALHTRIPEDAYDLLLPLQDLKPLDLFLVKLLPT